MTVIDVGFSPCPNDTFIFHAMMHGLVDTGDLKFRPRLHDVEELNRMAFDNTLPVSKLSFYAWLQLKEHYDILDSGAALGYGCGPLLVAKSADTPRTDAKIAVPGEHTTARLLLKLWKPEYTNIEIIRFDQIMDGIGSGKYDAGVIIHEGRFVYEQYRLRKIVDLGEWWERKTGAPIPLGCIAIRRGHPVFTLKNEIESAIKRSVEYAFANRNASREFIKKHAQEMADDVIDGHIGLYVNDFSLSLGAKGRKAVRKLGEMSGV